MNNIKKITITTANDEELVFIPKFPVKIIQHFSSREVPQNYGMITRKYNGIEVLVIMSAPDTIMGEIFPLDEAIENLINT